MEDLPAKAQNDYDKKADKAKTQRESFCLVCLSFIILFINIDCWVKWLKVIIKKQSNGKRLRLGTTIEIFICT
ncbi:hypothetical protein [Cytobacillus praedii]|uniref:hypothetical protein n=1 Tax=Cytobacillus praedii TaxID=1742358 RepID=UPI002E1C5486|nr:hypothetical protein [Cytobacillus praedii]